MTCKNNCIDGFIHIFDRETGEESVKKCQCLIDKQNAIYQDIVIQKAGLPSWIKTYDIEKDYLGQDINNNKEQVEKFIDNFNICKDLNLYFFSKKNGNQKTTVAQYILKEILFKKYSGYFILMNDLIRVLEEESYKKECDSFRDDLLKSDLLIIDDCFDKLKNKIYSSGYQLNFLDKFLRTRLEIYRKATIFTSNFSKDDIDSIIFTDSIKDLVKRNVYQLEFTDNYKENEIQKADFKIETFADRLSRVISNAE